MKKIFLLNIGLILYYALHAQQITFGDAHHHLKSADRATDSLRRVLIAKDTTVKTPAHKKPVKQLPEKPVKQLLKKPSDAIEEKRNH